MNGATAKAEIAAEARALGFDAVGFAAPRQADGVAADLGAFLAQGLHGDMDWLARHPERRAAPVVLWPEVRSVIAVGLNYGPDEDPLALLERRDRAAVSVYARGRDYHDVLKKRLKRLARFVAGRFETQVKVFVDTAPVMEKPLAMRAGVGWQGKHTNLVSREWGSWLFLGEVFTALELETRQARGRPLRLLPGLPRRLPDARLHGALPAGRDTLHLVSDHRAQGPYRRRVPPGHGQPGLRLRRLPGGLPLEQVRRTDRRGRLPAPRRADRAAPRRVGRPRRRRLPGPCSPARQSNAPGATASCATCSSQSAIRALGEIRAMRVWRRWPRTGSATHSPLVRAMAVWAPVAPARRRPLRGPGRSPLWPARPIRMSGRNGNHPVEPWGMTLIS